MTDKNHQDDPASENRDVHEVEGERGIPPVNSSKRRAGSSIGMVAIGLIALLAILAVNGVFSQEEESRPGQPTEKEKQRVVESNLPVLPEPEKKPALVSEEKKPAPVKPKIIRTSDIKPAQPKYRVVQNQKKELTPDERKRLPGVFADIEGDHRSSDSLQSAANGYGQTPSAFLGGGNDGGKSPLDERMTPTRMERVQAALLPDRNFLITQGTFIDCALETAISSDLPGYISCRVTQDVYSTNGNVKLLDRGSKIVGQYQGGLKRGQARIFALWNRVETPTGVIVSLDSPGTDALGRSGHGGYIDTHFWERFGGAILLSVIDDFGSYLAAKASDSDSAITVGSTTGTAQESAAIALENSINIPPTLYKNQGEHISIFVARDLDFSGVYQLAMEY
jgi:type IV secretion system protein VirB10